MKFLIWYSMTMDPVLAEQIHDMINDAIVNLREEFNEKIKELKKD